MKVVDIAVKRPVTVWMFTFAVLLFGMVSLSRLAVNLLPELSYPTLTIRTDYIGAAPAEVEQLISKPIEEAIGVVKGVRNVHSISKAGQSDVVLEFEWGMAMDMASLEVREKLDIIQLPLDVQKPLLLRFNPSLDPIIRMALKSKTSDNDFDEFKLKRLRTYADEDLKRKLESITGVASVKLGGGLEKEIQIFIDQNKTSQLGISIDQVISRLQQENINQSGGRVADGKQEYLVRTLNQFITLQDMRDIFIATVGDAQIRLSDIATVTDGYKERTSVTRINNAEAVEIAIYKEGDANTIDVASKVAKRLKSIEEELPQDYQLVQVYDQSTFIANAINEVKNAAIFGGLLAMIILYFFLKNIWTTLIVSISIPVSVIATFNLMYGNDISLNIMSLGGIALAVGLLVDNAIVVLENIARHQETSTNHKQAATLGTKEVSTAIIASTLTTMAVFFPLVFVEGIAGQLFRDQALTVTFALMASLIVALTLIPMLAARAKQPVVSITATDLDEQVTSVPSSDVPLSSKDNDSTSIKKSSSKLAKTLGYLLIPFIFIQKSLFYYLPLGLSIFISGLFRLLSRSFALLFKPLIWLFDRGYHAFELLYHKLLSTALHFRLLVLALLTAISMSSITLLSGLGVELIPPLSQGEFFVEISLQPGTPLKTTDETLKKIAVIAQQQASVNRTYTLAGTGSLMNASPAQGGDYWGRVNIVMNEGSNENDEKQVMTMLRTYLLRMPGVQAKFAKPELFTFKTPVEVELAGYDLEVMKRYSDRLVTLLEQNQRFVDVKSSLQTGQPEIKIHFDHARLAQLGLTAPNVAKLLANKVGGEVASQYSLKDRKIDILVRTSEQDRNSVTDIRQIIVNPGGAHPIPLSSVAEVDISVGPSEITRIGQQRVAMVSANLHYGDLNEAVLEIHQIIADMDIPHNIQPRITGQNEEMEVSFNSLKFALALAVFLVYLVMAAQFESLLHPLLILFTVPLAGAGSIYGLYITNTQISVIVFIGLIMLAGIVVNNAIVLIDRINQLRAQGINKQEAIIDAARTRLRPIVMTTLTTTLGLLPLAIGTGEGAEIRAPMAITVIFGLLYATLLTLFFIPLLYSLFDRKKFGAQYE